MSSCLVGAAYCRRGVISSLYDLMLSFVSDGSMRILSYGLVLEILQLVWISCDGRESLSNRSRRKGQCPTVPAKQVCFCFFWGGGCSIV